jgi:hypothetical protein
MRGGLFRIGFGLAGFGVLGACSNIIGLSSYDIDPSLDAGGSAGKTMTGDAGEPTGGTHNMTNAGGEPTGGSPMMNAGGEPTGGSTMMGDAGMAGMPITGGCQSAKDCDDTIDCTTDTCGANGECQHAPKDTLCDSSLCETCQAGIGCVAGPKTTMQLLADPNFDLDTGDWDDSGSDVANIMVVAAAQSGTRAAKFGPAPKNATEQQYSDVLQWVSIPKGTVALTLKGYYKLTPGTDTPADDYLVAALYEDGAIKPFTQLHSFEATAGAQPNWKAFTYSAPKSEVAMMGGNDYTFDLVAHVWDTVFHFDSLELNATVCQ